MLYTVVSMGGTTGPCHFSKWYHHATTESIQYMLTLAAMSLSLSFLEKRKTNRISSPVYQRRQSDPQKTWIDVGFKLNLTRYRFKI